MRCLLILSQINRSERFHHWHTQENLCTPITGNYTQGNVLLRKRNNLRCSTKLLSSNPQNNQVLFTNVNVNCPDLEERLPHLYENPIEGNWTYWLNPPCFGVVCCQSYNKI